MTDWRRTSTPAALFVVDALAADDRALAGHLSLLAEDRLDPTVVRLFPLAARHCAERLPRHPGLPLLLGLHRKARLRNLLLLRRGAAVVSELREQGWEPVALKGAPLLTGYYPDLGARPMSDLDLLLPSDVDPDRLRDALAAIGLRGHSRQVHAWTFVDDHELEYDLHRHLSPALAYPGAPSAVPGREWVRLGPVLTSTLTPEGHIAHALVHSSYWNTTASVRWIADIALIEQSRAPDWAEVVAILTRWGWVGAAGARVAFLADHGLVPDRAISAFSAARPDGRLDRSIQRAAQSDPRRHPARHVLHRTVLLPLRLARRTPGVGAWSYRHYLRDMWQVEETAGLGPALRRRVRDRVRHGADLPVFEAVDAGIPPR